MELVFVGDRCCDHSPSSGYDQVCLLYPEAGWLSGRALEAGQLKWHRAPKESTSSAHRVFHVFYGDCSGKALPEILRRQFPEATIVSSTHKPIDRLKVDRLAYMALKKSDAIVTVSDQQACELFEVGLELPIYSIPHGVWTKAFRPTSEFSGQHRQDVLLVGSFLRDWEGAKQVVELLAQAGVRSVALGAGAQENLAGIDAKVEVPSRVSESKLVEMYERSAALFLPFLEATASNALLEAMAAGCPVVSPRLPSIIEQYLGDDTDCFEKGRYDTAVSKLLHYVHNPNAREEKKRELMIRAKEFDWSHIKQLYTSTYKEVAAKKRHEEK